MGRWAGRHVSRGAGGSRRLTRLASAPAASRRGLGRRPPTGVGPTGVSCPRFSICQLLKSVVEARSVEPQAAGMARRRLLPTIDRCVSDVLRCRGDLGIELELRMRASMQRREQGLQATIDRLARCI